MKVRSMIVNAVLMLTIGAFFPGMMAGCSPAVQEKVSEPIQYETTVTPTKVLSNVIDGPYVFYRKNRIIVKNIQRIESKAEVVQQVYPNTTKNLTISCAMDPKAGKPFDVVIRGKHLPPPSTYEQPDKLLALSDIEGNFKIMVETLQGNGVIDEDYQWSYGKGHLVLVGDFFDRGNQVTPCLWLMYELERQAELAGGRVHFIIGNHEEMNMRGDVRYVRNKYKLAARKLNVTYRSLYGKHTELGRWLRSKNVIEKIGKTIFTHGGLSHEMARMNLHFEDINRIARGNFGMDAWRVKEKGGATAMIFGKLGPMWYRGYFNNELSQTQVNNLLIKYGAKQVVVGHTVVNEVSALYNFKIIAIDVKHEMVFDHGGGNALLIKGGRFLQVNPRGQISQIGIFKHKSTELALKAIIDNNEQALKKFLTAGNDINGYYTKEKVTLLHYAIRKNRPKIIAFLIDSGADPNKYYQNKTALMYAIKKQNLNAIKSLLNKGVDVNAVNQQQKTALYYVAKYGDPQVARLLIDNGANLIHKDQSGKTPLEYAEKNANTAVASFLRSLQ
ncbi:MAG: ankyrin repeat domain-containing protein [Bacteroidota bacterium]